MTVILLRQREIGPDSVSCILQGTTCRNRVGTEAGTEKGEVTNASQMLLPRARMLQFIAGSRMAVFHAWSKLRPLGEAYEWLAKQ